MQRICHNFSVAVPFCWRVFCFCRVAFICLASFFVCARRGVRVCSRSALFFYAFRIKRNVFAGCCCCCLLCCLSDLTGFYCTIPFAHCRTQLHFNEHGSPPSRSAAGVCRTPDTCAQTSFNQCRPLDAVVVVRFCVCVSVLKLFVYLLTFYARFAVIIMLRLGTCWPRSAPLSPTATPFRLSLN